MKTKKRVPTADICRSGGVPIVLLLACVISSCLKKEKKKKGGGRMATNCDVEESPFRYLCSVGDRVGEVVGRSLCRCKRAKCAKFLVEEGNSR